MARYTKQSKTSDDPFGGEPISKGMSSGNSRATQGNSAADNSRNVGESKRGSKAPTDSGNGNWGMESMPQNYKGDNTQKPQSITPTSKDGSRPALESKGDVNGMTSRRAPSKTDLGHEKKVLTSSSHSYEPSMGGTSGMKGMKGSRSGGSHGDFHDKRSRM